MSRINWTTVIIALAALGALVALSYAGGAIPEELRALVQAVIVVILASTKKAIEAPPAP